MGIFRYVLLPFLNRFFNFTLFLFLLRHFLRFHIPSYFPSFFSLLILNLNQDANFFL